MGFFDQISGVLEQYTSQTQVPREQAHQDYDKIAATVPPNVLGSVIGPALSSLGAGEVEQRIRNSAEQMGPSTRSQFLQKLLNAIGSGGGNTASVLSQVGVDPSLAQQPERASADDVARVAAQVHQSHPDGFNRAMEFYTAHPTLVKVLGTMAIAKIAQHLSAQSRSTH
jgi:hypothetical protein